MSVTNSSSASSDGEGQSGQIGFYDTVEQVRRYIRALPWAFGEKLSEHVAHAQHEDVLGDAVKAPEDHTPVTEAIQPSIPLADPKIPARLRPIIPPDNFGAVVKGSIYRSAYPRQENYGFLKSLGLKTILTLVPEPLPNGYRAFIVEHGIQHFQVHIPANKGTIKIGACEMSRALDIVLDRSNHPLLIHCNKGKHRTGCVVGCFRRVQGEEPEEVFREYHAYADPKARFLDEVFIEQKFDENTVLWMARRHNWVAPLESEDYSAPSSSVSATSVEAIIPQF